MTLPTSLNIPTGHSVWTNSHRFDVHIYEKRPHSMLPTRYIAIKPFYCVKRLRVRDKVMTRDPQIS